MLPHTSGWGNGNFWRRWADVAPTEEIAAITARSLRDVLDVASPTILEITTGEFGTPMARVSSGLGAHLDLRRGQRIRNEENGRAYLVGDRVGQGGFGVVYRAEQASGDPLENKELCLKVCGDVLSWHCEAYFGHLLQGESRVVKVFDSFAWIPRTKDAQPRYCLITEFAEHGDLAKYFQDHPAFSERKLKTRMVLQVHDELLFEVPTEETAEVEELVRSEMEGVVKLNVPLVADLAFGANWRDL